MYIAGTCEWHRYEITPASVHFFPDTVLSYSLRVSALKLFNLPPGSRTRSGRYKKRLSLHRISGTIYITGGNNNDPYQRAARPYRRSRGRI